jgi:hypothetical protein
MTIKRLTIFLNLIAFGFMFYLFFDKGAPSQKEEYWVWLVLLLPLLNIFVLSTTNKETDDIFSLWIKVKKKKLKDELEK